MHSWRRLIPSRWGCPRVGGNDWSLRPVGFPKRSLRCGPFYRVRSALGGGAREAPCACALCDAALEDGIPTCCSLLFTRCFCCRLARLLPAALLPHASRRTGRAATSARSTAPASTGTPRSRRRWGGREGWRGRLVGERAGSTSEGGCCQLAQPATCARLPRCTGGVQTTACPFCGCSRRRSKDRCNN